MVKSEIKMYVFKMLLIKMYSQINIVQHFKEQLKESFGNTLF